jgi:hypothetical protein
LRVLSQNSSLSYDAFSLWTTAAAAYNAENIGSTDIVHKDKSISKSKCIFSFCFSFFVNVCVGGVVNIFVVVVVVVVVVWFCFLFYFKEVVAHL